MSSLRPAPSLRGPRSLHYASSQIYTKGEDLVVTLAGVPWPSAADVASAAPPPPPPPPAEPPTKSTASAYSVATGVHPHSPHVYSLFAVFDGHAGSAAARHCAREVAAAVHAALPPGDPPLAEREGCACAACVPGPAPPPTPAAEGEAVAGNGGKAVAVAMEVGGDDGGVSVTTTPVVGEEDPAAAAAAWRGGLARALTAAIHTLHLTWAAHGRCGGCTATLVLQAGRLLTVANVGDSHAALDLPGGGGVLALTGDHRVDGNAREAARVRAAGGRVTNLCPSGRGPAADPRTGVGPLRVWAGGGEAEGGAPPAKACGGGVANARVVGDLDLPAGLLVTSPSVAQVRLPLEGGRLVLASDGVWDSLGMGRVARAARPHAAPEAADAVITATLAAQGHEPRDDASVVVVDLLPPGVPSFPEAAGKKLKRSASRAAALAVAGSPDSSTLGGGGGEAGGSGRGGGSSRHPRPSTDEEADAAAATTTAVLVAAAEAAAASGRFGAGAPKALGDDGEAASGRWRRPGGGGGGGGLCCMRPPRTAGEDAAATATATTRSPVTSPSRRLTRDFTIHGGRAFGSRASGDGGGGAGDGSAIDPSVRSGSLFHGGGGSGRSGGFFADLSTRGGSAFFGSGGGGGGGGGPGGAGGTPRAKADILVRLDVAVELGQLPPAGSAAALPGGSGHGGGGGGGRLSLSAGGSGRGGDAASDAAAASAEGTAHGGLAAAAAWLDEELKAALLATQEDAARLHAAASIGRSASPVGGRRAARARAAAAVTGGPLTAALARARAAEAAAALAAGRGEPAAVPPP